MLAVMEQLFLSLSHAVAASLKESALSGCLCLLTQRSGLAGRLLPRTVCFFIFGLLEARGEGSNLEGGLWGR